jgi:8-oxo-dGTP diphosphatase
LRKTPVTWKNRLARIVRNPIIHRLMVWGIQITVPQQRIGVALILFNDAERVLLLHHVFHPYAPWGVPGGWLERNEAPAAGALRELREETGLTAVLGPVIYVTHESNPNHIGIAYLAHIEFGELSLSAEIIDAHWFSTDQLPDGMLPFTREAIKAAVRVNSGLAVQD